MIREGTQLELRPFFASLGKPKGTQLGTQHFFELAFLGAWKRAASYSVETSISGR